MIRRAQSNRKVTKNELIRVFRFFICVIREFARSLLLTNLILFLIFIVQAISAYFAVTIANPNRNYFVNVVQMNFSFLFFLSSLRHTNCVI